LSIVLLYCQFVLSSPLYKGRAERFRCSVQLSNGKQTAKNGMEHSVMEQREESVVELRQGLKHWLDALTSPTAPADALPHASSRKPTLVFWHTLKKEMTTAWYTA